MTKNTKLYRPLRYKELELIIASEMKRFPPRGFWQPIFYPVLNLRYASEIAEAWESDDAHIVSFEIPKTYFDKFPIQTIRESYRQELWVPAWQLNEFNEKIVGEIRLDHS